MNIKMVLVAVIGALGAAFAALMQRVRGAVAGGQLEVQAANDGMFALTHKDGIIRYQAAAAIKRYILVKKGADDAHVQVAGASDFPTRITLDEAAAADEWIAVASLPSMNGTIKLVSDGTAAIAVDDLLVPATGGKVKTIAAGAGNYFIVGRALTAVANGASGEDAYLEAETLVCFQTK